MAENALIVVTILWNLDSDQTPVIIIDKTWTQRFQKYKPKSVTTNSHKVTCVWLLRFTSLLYLFLEVKHGLS